MSKLRVLVADGHEVVRWLVVRLLFPKFDVAASIADGEQLIDVATILNPDVIVSDIRMPLFPGPKAMRELRASGLHCPFVLISGTPVAITEYMDEGARVFVNKLDMGYELVPAVGAASDGRVYFSRSWPSIGISSASVLPAETRFHELSNRDKKIRLC